MTNPPPPVFNIPVSEKMYMLAKQYVYQWEIEQEGGKVQYKIVVPEGFMYDGASVPRIAWSLSGITPDGLMRAPALVHDWIYAHKGKLPDESYQFKIGKAKWKPVLAVWAREAADKLFARMMRESGVSKPKRRMVYRAVRWFGGFSWD